MPYKPSVETGVNIQAQSMLDEMMLQARGGPGVEPPTAAMYQAVIERRARPAIGAMINRAGLAAEHRGINTAAALSLLRTSLVDYFRFSYSEHGRKFSDVNRLSPEDWDEPMSMLEESLTTDKGMAIISIAGIEFFRAATPVTSRYYAIELVAQLVAQDRFPNGIRALDIGSSIMAGALQLAYKEEFPMSFDRITIAPPAVEVETDVTTQANEKIAGQPVFKEIVCVDSFPFYYDNRQVYDVRNAEFSLSGLRPSERESVYFDIVRSLMAKKHKMSASYDPDSPVTFYLGDFLDPVEFADFRDRFSGSFDVIMMNYLTQELTPADQLRMHEITDRLLAENGIKIYNHQAYLHPWNVRQPAPITNVRHYKHYATEAYRSSMHLVDNLHPVSGIQEMMRYFDNRCRIARIGAGKLVVNGSLEPLADLVLKD